MSPCPLTFEAVPQADALRCRQADPPSLNVFVALNEQKTRWCWPVLVSLQAGQTRLLAFSSSLAVNCKSAPRDGGVSPRLSSEMTCKGPRHGRRAVSVLVLDTRSKAVMAMTLAMTSGLACRY